MTRRLTTEEFIKHSREVHGDKYDYSKVEYVNNSTDVCIVCSKHGEFWQKPSSHLQGKGCPKCANNRSVGIDEFIRKAKEIHGDKYDYSKVQYVNANTKVCIICPEHGEFWQIPYSHLIGKGCKKCVNPNYGLTTDEFIRKAKEIHGDKYDYSKVEYVDTKSKVCIICPEHGEFWQTPTVHLRGNGCKKCCGNDKVTAEDFIRRAKEIHGDKYDYSKVIINGMNSKVCIICPEHGEFLQRAADHIINERGCPKCSGCKKLTTEEFICKAKGVHGNKYDYSKTKYVNNQTPLSIICNIHGEFMQRPVVHLKGCGCPTCNNGYTKQYKFNLLQEFESEYEFRAFLENNDINILYVILRNIEPKFEPIKGDIVKALKNIELKDTIKALEEKYTKDDEEETEETSTDKKDEESTTTDITNVDLDDDDAINQILESNNKNKDGETNQEPTIEDIIKNEEKELQVISKIEHMLTPEDREYIMQKFLNDKTRMWMAEREALKNV